MSLIQNLEEKIDSILQDLEAKNHQINALTLKLEKLEKLSQQKDLQIAALYEEIAQRDKAVESLYGKISNALQESQQKTND